MTKIIIHFEIVLIYTEVCMSQFLNIPLSYFNNKGLQKYNYYNNNYDFNNNRQEKSRYSKKFRKIYNSERDNSVRDLTQECGTCSCNECYKSKPCCKSMCNECKSLVLVPYPVPYLVPEMLADSRTTHYTASISPTTTTKKREVTSTDKAPAITIKTDDQNKSIPKNVIENYQNVDRDNEKQTNVAPLEESVPLLDEDALSPETCTVTTSPVFVCPTNNIKLKYKLCPRFPKGACVPKKTTKKDDYIKDYSANRKQYSSFYLYTKALINYQNSRRNVMPLRRTDLISSTKSYYIPLKDIIPIPDEIAEKLLF